MEKKSADNYSQLINGLKDQSEEKRLQAIRQIRQNCSLEFYDELVAIFQNDESPQVRAESVETLVWLAFNNLSDDIIQNLKEMFTAQKETKTSPELQATLLSGIIALKNLENIQQLINTRENLTAETRKDEEKIKSLQEKILKDAEEKNSLNLQIQKLTGELDSLRNTLQEKEQEREKLITDIGNFRQREKEQIKFIRLIIAAAVFLLFIITGSILLISQKKIQNIQKEHLQKIKANEAKINEYQTLVYSYEAKLKDLGVQKSQMEENIKKIQEIEEMKKEINKLAGEALVASDETRKFFMKCHDAFFNVDIQTAGVDLAYKKKKGFLEAARLILAGKSSQSRRIYSQTINLK